MFYTIFVLITGVYIGQKNIVPSVRICAENIINYLQTFSEPKQLELTMYEKVYKIFSNN